jgi:uncharacterized protein
MAGRINSLVVKVAQRCNLNCSYCYVYNHEDQSYRSRPRFMSEEAFEQLLVRVGEYCDRHAGTISMVFHGGEPTLIGPVRLGRMAERASATLGARLSYLGMQTNAVLIDEAWLETIRTHQIRVGVSMDGPPEVHDLARVDHGGRGSHAAAVRGLQLLREADLLSAILCVINPGQSGVAAYRHFRSLGITRMNFLLPDVSHDSKVLFYGDYGETPVADYLIPLFDEWFDEDDPRVRVGIFWELISSIMGGRGDTDAFGNSLMNYLIVDTDGSIQTLDTLKVCEEGLSESGLNVFEHGFDDFSRGRPFVHRLLYEGVPLAAQCRACPESATCGGGYLPHRYARANGFDNPSVWCKDILKLLAHIRRRTGYVSP